MSRRVLIVEDNPDGRETLRRLLTLWGYEVEAAADGLEGLQRGLASAPAAAIIDINMPRLNGLAVARGLREALGPDVVLIAYTAYGDADTARRTAEAGFDTCLTKPSGLATLEQWLKARMGGPLTPQGGPAAAPEQPGPPA
jgi:CheY-like chemotaxis protein